MPSHGALSKSGKVRTLTPKIPRSTKRTKGAPRVSKRKKHRRRVVLGRNTGRYGTQGGQYDPFSRRYRRRRRR